jgi:hypothetical protein
LLLLLVGGGWSPGDDDECNGAEGGGISPALVPLAAIPADTIAGAVDEAVVAATEVAEVEVEVEVEADVATMFELVEVDSGWYDGNCV